MEQLNSNLNGDPTYEYNVDWGVVHPQYLACDRDSQDIGLIRLAREAQLDNFRIQPICLPLQFDPKFDTVEGDEEMVVYTSGWGRLYTDCATDEFGPAKGAECNFPFKYKGNTFNQCNRNLNPSTKVDKENIYKDTDYFGLKS